MNVKKKTQSSKSSVMYQSYLKLCSMMKGTNSLKLFNYLMCLIRTFLVITMISSIQELVNLCIGAELSLVKSLVWKLLALIVAYMLISLVYQLSFRFLTVKGKGILWEKLYALLMHKESSFYGTKESGDIVSLIHNDAKTVSEYIATGTLSIVSQASIFLLNFGIMLSISVPITLITTALLILSFVSTDVLNKKVADSNKEAYGLVAESTQFMLQSIQAFSVIKMLQREDYFIQKYKALVKNQIYQKDKKISIYLACYLTVFTGVAFVVPVLVLTCCIYAVSTGNLNVGQVLALYALTQQLNQPIVALSNSLNLRKSAIALSARLYAILFFENEAERTAEFALSDTTNVSISEFSYGEKEILRDVKFTINKNEVVCIKGRSGIGKSTIAKLLSRLLIGKENAVCVDGTDINTIRKEDLYSNILVATQHANIISGTLLENLLLGEQYSEEELQEVIDTVQLTEFVRKEGLDAIISEGAANISGGQCQRIGIARMLLRKPKLLILDEPTSALDDGTAEKFVVDMVAYAHKYDIKLLVISHRDDFDGVAGQVVRLGN